MQLGMIGLGRMGANLVRRLMRDGHECVGLRRQRRRRGGSSRREGATGAHSLEEFVRQARRSRARSGSWCPAAFVGSDDRRARDAPRAGRHHHRRRQLLLPRRHRPRRARSSRRASTTSTVGTSGGVFGPRARLLPDDRRRGRRRRRTSTRSSDHRARGRQPPSARPGRTGDAVDRASTGYLHCGPNGAGHFVKMVHNGIEYGIMAAYAEGLNVLRNANVGTQEQTHRRRDHAAARPAVLPVRPRHRRRSPRCGGAAASSRRGCSTSPPTRWRSSPDLDDFEGRVSDSGEGRWTVHAAIDEGVPADVLTAALFERFASRGQRRLRRQAALGHAQGVRRPRREDRMSVVRINAITVPASGRRSSRPASPPAPARSGNSPGLRGVRAAASQRRPGRLPRLHPLGEPGGVRRLGVELGVHAWSQGPQHPGAGVEPAAAGRSR